MGENNSNISDAAATGAQTAAPGVNAGEVNNVARQLEASISTFAQQTGKTSENSIALTRQAVGQHPITNANVPPKPRADSAAADNPRRGPGYGPANDCGRFNLFAGSRQKPGKLQYDDQTDEPAASNNRCRRAPNPRAN